MARRRRHAAVTSSNRLPLEVAEQPVPADRGDEEVRPAVVVVIADRDAHAEELDIEPERRGHVLERAIAAVAVECLGRPCRPLARAGRATAGS